MTKKGPDTACLSPRNPSDHKASRKKPSAGASFPSSAPKREETGRPSEGLPRRRLSNAQLHNSREFMLRTLSEASQWHRSTVQGESSLADSNSDWNDKWEDYHSVIGTLTAMAKGNRCRITKRTVRLAIDRSADKQLHKRKDTSRAFRAGMFKMKTRSKYACPIKCPGLTQKAEFQSRKGPKSNNNSIRDYV
uniref:Uncharacterized protein n=1 Tax=Steinernema glaseri TaxID=37863 RepID=A0A1I8AVJ1_9BILA